MEPKTFRRVAAVAWFMQALIVVSGAAVRLTEAGLGCEDWPTCNEDKILPEWQLHGLIEFGNRLISVLVAVSAIVVVVAAYRRRPRRADLTGYAWAILAGTVTQVVLGGITVILDLHPIVVSVHFLVSMGLLYAAQVLWFRAGSAAEPTAGGRPNTPILIRAQLALATMVLLTGTIVTGTGPNSGDSRADRLGFELESVVRVHAVFVWLLLATLVALAVGVVRNPESTARSAQSFVVLRWQLLAVLAQGAVGYTQYALGVPALLVELHVIGAITIWILCVLLYLVSERERADEVPEWSHEYAS